MQPVAPPRTTAPDPATPNPASNPASNPVASEATRTSASNDHSRRRGSSGLVPRAANLWDLAACGALALAAAACAVALPAGSPLRFTLAIPALLFVPGYALLEACTGLGRRASHALVAIGLSPALVALAALATAVFPGGFRPIPIVAVTTVMSLAFTLAACVRRTLAAPRLVPGELASAA